MRVNKFSMDQRTVLQIRAAQNKQRAITQKLSKQELRFMCTPLPLMRSVDPQNFITIGTLLHYGSLPFTSVVGSGSRPSSRGIFVT